MKVFKTIVHVLYYLGLYFTSAHEKDIQLQLLKIRQEKDKRQQKEKPLLWKWLNNCKANKQIMERRRTIVPKSK
jgi:hypothetical protein